MEQRLECPWRVSGQKELVTLLPELKEVFAMTAEGGHQGAHLRRSDGVFLS